MTLKLDSKKIFSLTVICAVITNFFLLNQIGLTVISYASSPASNLFILPVKRTVSPDLLSSANYGNISKNLISDKQIDLCPKIAEDSVATNPDNLLTLVDKFQSLPQDYIPNDLVNISNFNPAFPSIGKIRQIALNPLLDMLNALARENIKAQINSAYRDSASQGRVYGAWVKNTGSTKAQEYAALPAHSEHQLGTTIDIVAAANNNKQQYNYNQSRLFAWLHDNAFLYGFEQSYPRFAEQITGYSYEPWHYRYVGVETAIILKQKQITLTEYLYRINGICP